MHNKRAFRFHDTRKGMQIYRTRQCRKQKNPARLSVRDLIIYKAFVLLNENLVLAYYVNTLLQALGCLNSLDILLNEHTVESVNVNNCFL